MKVYFDLSILFWWHGGRLTFTSFSLWNWKEVNLVEDSLDLLLIDTCITFSLGYSNMNMKHSDFMKSVMTSSYCQFLEYLSPNICDILLAFKTLTVLSLLGECSLFQPKKLDYQVTQLCMLQLDAEEGKSLHVSKAIYQNWGMNMIEKWRQISIIDKMCLIYLFTCLSKDKDV